MKIIESFEHIKTPWISRLSKRFVSGEDLREDFEQSLREFFHYIKQALETGDSAWLDTVLDDWVHSRTQSDLEDKQSSLTPIVNQIMLETSDVAQEFLDADDALALNSALLPIFFYSSEYVSRQETAMHIDHIAKELEKANATLESLDKNKSDFIAIAAHELKTPLTLIEGYAAMLRDQVSNVGELNQVRLLLKGIDNGTLRLREIINDMIDVSLIDNNLLSLNFQPVWLNRLLKVISDEHLGVIQDRQLEFEIVQFPGISEMTFGDEERLYQAFRNLISNSIKYTPDYGTITIHGRKLPGFVEVTIADSGIGIDPEDHSRIFEKFGRIGSVSLHSSGKTKYKGGGPGLGLPITKGILEAHGGAIWVESPGYDEENCPGSTFHVLLPIRKVPPDSKTAKLFHPLIDQEEIEGT